MEVEPKLYRAIMVSSTFTDLEAHRREVIDAIHRFGFHANVMEYSGARSDSDVIDTSLRMVHDSAAYLCVIGHKYGQTPVDPDRNPKGLSITELEFNEARRLGKPILLFLMGDDHPVTKDDVEPDSKKRRKLEAFRKHAKRMDTGGPAHRVYDTFESKEEFAKKAAIAVGLEAIRMAGASEVPDRAIRDAIARFIDIKPDANQAELTDAIERFEAGYHALEQQLATITVTDNRVTSLKAAAEAALAEGDLDKARAAYREAAEAARDKAAEPVRTAAELKSAEAGAHLLALDWQAADAAWTEAVAMLILFDRGAAENMMDSAAERLKSHAEMFARSGALRAAVRYLRALTHEAQARDDWREVARLQNNVGNNLALQGEWVGGAEGQRLLAEGISSIREALNGVPQQDSPTFWAMMQSNLGDALRVQGEHLGGEEGVHLLKQAVTAFKKGLSVFSLKNTPFEWAVLQNNIGIALAIQSDLAESPNESKLKLLSAAVAAFRRSIKVNSSVVPAHEWARMQTNLGNALQALSILKSGSASKKLLNESIAAYGIALRVYTDANVPAGEAWVQACLGGALILQGQRSEGEARCSFFTESIQAYLKSLTIYTLSDTPVDWATTQINLGSVYELMADADSERARAHLANAEAAFIATLQVYTPDFMAERHVVAIASLARIRAKLAGLDS